MHLLKDIRFWIVLAFLLRLVGITNPPLEAGHNWRQTTVTMVARNFSEVDANIFYPRIDFAGEKTGITGMEFPIFNYLIFGANELFGYQHWYGRLINLVFSSFGIYFFFLLVRRYWNRETAFWSALILIFSVWFVFSRKIMPDTFSMTFLLGGIFFASNFLREKGSFIDLFIASLLITVGVLSKLPSGYLLSIIPVLVISERSTIKRTVLLGLGMILALIPAFWWYFIWVPHLVKTYDFWHFFMGKSITQGITEIGEHLPLTLSRFYDSALKFVGFGLFVLGVFSAIRHSERKTLVVLLIAFSTFLIIIFKAGFTFAHHSYYIIPFVPVMALLAGYFLSKVEKQYLRISLILIVAIECIGNNIQDFSIPERLASTQNLERELDKLGGNELIFINSEEVPTPMYFAHRKGWIGYNGNIENQHYTDSLISLGLSKIIIVNEGFGTSTKLNLPILYKSKAFTIYSAQ
ncbi:MAG: ArnT family glycosyltransferase [Crocinitomicaceae bacterium]